MARNIQEYSPELWNHYMRCGDFEAAWKCSDAEMKSRAGIPCWHLPRHFQYIWNGTPLTGKRVLVRCYHGLGDTIQFIRYMPLVKAIAASVTVWAQQPIISLLETVEGIDQLLPLHDGSPEGEFDVDVEIMELPHLFRTMPATIPAEIPYLHVDPMPLSGNNGLPAVGLVWKAGDWDENRSIPFSVLAPLAGISGIHLYVLQADATAAGWQEGFGIYPGEFSIYDYARVIKSLNLLISVDSMPAHLAGALGVPVWNLLYANADWRWMEHRDDSPWYPTMRIFRQERMGDWEGVINKVMTALKDYQYF